MIHHMVAMLKYYWLPLATTHLGYAIGNFKLEVYFEMFYLFGVEDSLGILKINFEGPSLVFLGYHWLPVATIHTVGDNKELKFET